MLAAPHLKMKPQCSQSCFDELDFRRWILEHIALAIGGSQQYLSDHFRVSCVRDTERNDVGRERAGPAPVRHALRDELGVRYDNRHVLVGDERRGAGRDLLDFPDTSRNLDAVAYRTMAPSASRIPTSKPRRASTWSISHRVTRRVTQTSTDINAITVSSLSGVNSLPAIPDVRNAWIRRHTSTKDDMR
jgi:hypothetical protein